MLQNQEYYMNLQMEPQDNPLTTCPIQPGWKTSIKPYLNSQLGFIDGPDPHCGNSSVTTQTQTRSDSMELLLTLYLATFILSSYSEFVETVIYI